MVQLHDASAPIAMTPNYWIAFICVVRFYFGLLPENKPGVAVSVPRSSSIQPTVRYTELAPSRFKNPWR
jgi:hypothetical protein